MAAVTQVQAQAIARATRTLFQGSAFGQKQIDGALHVLMDLLENGNAGSAQADNLLKRAANQRLFGRKANQRYLALKATRTNARPSTEQRRIKANRTAQNRRARGEQSRELLKLRAN